MDQGSSHLSSGMAETIWSTLIWERIWESISLMRRDGYDWLSNRCECDRGHISVAAVISCGLVKIGLLTELRPGRGCFTLAGT